MIVPAFPDLLLYERPTYWVVYAPRCFKVVRVFK